MPEGDTILWAATRLRPVLEGQVPDRVEMPAAHPRAARGSPDRDRWPVRLQGRRVLSIETRGKHLFLLFEGGLALHSHLMMTGSWSVESVGQPWRRARSRAWIVFECAGRQVVQFDGPVLRLLATSRLRFDQRLGRLGPDILAPAGFDQRRFLARLRAGEPDRSLGDALLDQTVIAGIGNGWKVEGCWLAGLDPARRVDATSDAELEHLVAVIRPRMLASGLRGPQRELGRHPRIYGSAGRPCPRCGTRVRGARQGHGGRMTYWCPGCQR